MSRRDADTRRSSYTEYLVRLQTHPVKSLLQPVNPYRRNIRRLCHGRVLDVGCGIGRNLGYLNRPDSIGVDHNQHSVDFARSLGHQVLTDTEFRGQFQDFERSFDTIVMSHVLEHLTFDGAVELVTEYLPTLAPSGRIVVICPQERGHAYEASHVTYFDEPVLHQLGEKTGLRLDRYLSFPLPPVFGRLWIYNEHIGVFTATSS